MLGRVPMAMYIRRPARCRYGNVLSSARSVAERGNEGIQVRDFSASIGVDTGLHSSIRNGARVLSIKAVCEIMMW